MKKIVIALMSMGLLLLSGCAAQTPGLTEEDLIGVWKEVASPHYLHFYPDGTYHLAESVTRLEDSPDEEGQFRLEAILLTFITSGEGHFCPGQSGTSGTYEVELTEEGWLRFTLSEDPCEGRANFNRRAIWQPFSP